MVVGVSCNLLRNICSCMITIYFTEGSYFQQYYSTGKVLCGCQSIHKNCKLFHLKQFANYSKQLLSLLQSSIVASYLKMQASKNKHTPVVQSSIPFQLSIPLFVPTLVNTVHTNFTILNTNRNKLNLSKFQKLQRFLFYFYELLSYLLVQFGT